MSIIERALPSATCGLVLHVCVLIPSYHQSTSINNQTTIIFNCVAVCSSLLQMYTYVKSGEIRRWSSRTLIIIKINPVENYVYMLTVNKGNNKITELKLLRAAIDKYPK